MGYDLEVDKGNVRLPERRTLVCELLEFAAQMELEVIPVNWMAFGTIPDFSLRLRRIFGEEEWTLPFVCRPVTGKRQERGEEIPLYSIDHEHIQGVVFCHHYEEWVLTWNVTRDGLLAKYAVGEWGNGGSPMALLDSVDEVFFSPPEEMRGEFEEGPIHIHCPWRRSDAAAACDIFTLLSHHCDGFAAHDDLAVWPNKDWSKWTNLAAKYAKVLGTEPTHPDVADEL